MEKTATSKPCCQVGWFGAVTNNTNYDKKYSTLFLILDQDLIRWIITDWNRAKNNPSSGRRKANEQWHTHSRILSFSSFCPTSPPSYTQSFSPFISPHWAFYIKLAWPWPPAGDRCPWDLSHHCCIPAYHFTSPLMDVLSTALCLLVLQCVLSEWNTVCSFIFTVCVKVSSSRPWSPCSLRSITAAVDSSHCAAAPVEIISLSAACLSPRCQLMPTVVCTFSLHSHTAVSKCSFHHFLCYWF